VDYSEACLVLPDSEEASAALSRRCLQHLLREKSGAKKGDLANEIQQVLDSGKLPTYLAEDLDAIRNIGNFAAHPVKATNSGAIVDVEPREAEWLLNVLEGLFDFYFVQPGARTSKTGRPQCKIAKHGQTSAKDSINQQRRASQETLSINFLCQKVWFLTTGILAALNLGLTGRPPNAQASWPDLLIFHGVGGP
jgi:Domain of unknown function (DUF4145)